MLLPKGNMRLLLQVKDQLLLIIILLRHGQLTQDRPFSLHEATIMVEEVSSSVLTFLLPASCRAQLLVSAARMRMRPQSSVDMVASQTQLMSDNYRVSAQHSPNMQPLVGTLQHLERQSLELTSVLITFLVMQWQRLMLFTLAMQNLHMMLQSSPMSMSLQ